MQKSSLESSQGGVNNVFPLIIKSQGRNFQLDLSPLSELKKFEVKKNSFSFDLEFLTHCYLTPAEYKSFAQPPKKSHLEIMPGQGYYLSGGLTQRGGECQLWLIEFSEEGKRISDQKVVLTSGVFRRYWKPSPLCHKVAIALRISAKGYLKISTLSLNVATAEPKQVHYHKPRVFTRLASFADKLLVPRSIKPQRVRFRKAAAMFDSFKYDFLNYEKYSLVQPKPKDRVNLERQVMIAYHCVEKALAFKNVKPGFGKAVVEQLMEDLEKYFQKFGSDEVLMTGMKNIEKYIEHNRLHGIVNEKLNENARALMNKLPEAYSCFDHQATIERTKKEIEEATNIDFEKFINHRHSVRDFSNEPVPLEKIVRALDIAKRTPSACNRQAWKVHYYDGKEKEAMLKLNRGHRGFTDAIDKLLVITGETRLFRGPGERHQVYIDLGLFSMMLVLSLHSENIGVCTMALAVNAEEEKRIKHVGEIPDSERLIMMMALGSIPEKLKVPTSARREVHDFFTNHSITKESLERA